MTRKLGDPLFQPIWNNKSNQIASYSKLYVSVIDNMENNLDLLNSFSKTFVIYSYKHVKHIRLEFLH